MFIAVPVATFAQITITENDYAQIQAFGTLLQGVNQASSTLDIGSPGQNSWDFSSLSEQIFPGQAILDPLATPFSTDFPNATHAFGPAFGSQLGIWSYTALGNNRQEVLGSVTKLQENVATFNFNEPPEIDFQFPMTSGSAWPSRATALSVTVTDGIAGDTTRTTLVRTNSVDAFGTMKLPDGRTVDALRIKKKLTEIRDILGVPTVVGRTLMYTFVSRTGESVFIITADTLQSDSGLINGLIVGWSKVDATNTAVDEVDIPSTSSLLSNYPNPFNPQTTISYQLARSGRVQLNIYNAIGERVATLVHALKPAGEHTFTFDASDLPSGIYFYSLTTGDVRQTRKMVLLK